MTSPASMRVLLRQFAPITADTVVERLRAREKRVSPRLTT
jgi:hypothetical protein